MKSTQTSLPPRISQFDLVTLQGKTYRQRDPAWLDRMIRLLRSMAEPLIVSAVVIGLIYSAGLLAEAIEPLASDSCRS